MVNYKVENLVFFVPSGLVKYTGNKMVNYEAKNLVCIFKTFNGYQYCMSNHDSAYNSSLT